MGCEEDVLKIVKKIDKLVANKSTDADPALDYLKALNNLPMTLEVLQKTRVGMTVNSLRKSSSDDAVITLAKSLIKSWKKLLGGVASEKKEKSSNSSEKKNDDRSSNNGSESSASHISSDAGLQKAFPKAGSNTSDSVRLKCREMLSNALLLDEIPEGSLDREDVAAQLEDVIFAEFGDVNMKYKNRIRSRVANLKDSKNPHLRINVLTGVIAPERLATMTAEELASDEMKQLRQKLTKEAINDHQMSVTSGTKTSLLKCGKCKKRNCTYNQVQTRSADEPMTTFVLCNECGHRWKFC